MVDSYDQVPILDTLPTLSFEALFIVLYIEGQYVVPTFKGSHCGSHLQGISLVQLGRPPGSRITCANNVQHSGIDVATSPGEIGSERDEQLKRTFVA